MLRSSIRRAEAGGFTLIELLVVVAIIGGIFTVAGTVLLSRLQSANSDGDVVAAMEAARPLSQSAPVASAGEGYAPPTLLASDVRVDLTGEPVLDGYQLRTHYLARFSGTFRVRSEGPTLTLRFPFPPDTREIRDVSLSLLGEDGELYEPEGIRYDLSGVTWTGATESAGGAPTALTVVVNYTTAGRDAFVYDISGGDRTGDVSVTLTVDGVEQVVVPGDALQPTEREDDLLRWRYGSLITTSPIAVELPAGASPLGRSLTLLRVAGVGVMLFGAGFWYMGQRRRHEAMATFRLGHFLLLALNYSLFYAALAVLSYWLPLALSIAAAALLSLPLLLLHVSRITDRRFALRVTPLAMVTLAAPVAAAVLPDQRVLAVLALVVVSLGWLTLTWRSWWDAWVEREAETIRAIRQRADVARQEERRRETAAKAEAALAVLRQSTEASGVALGAARLALEECHRAEALRGPVARAVARLERVLQDNREAAKSDAASEVEEPALNNLRLARERAAPLVDHRRGVLTSATAALEKMEATLESAEAAAAMETAEHNEHNQHNQHCPACGHGLAEDARFCGGCGAAHPAALGCGGCGDVTVLPAHLLRSKWRSAELHCGGCGAGLS